jgi:acyl carrier protein
MAEKTGYDVDMLETDMNMETDLGIDSIKRVEILGEVQTTLDVTVTDMDTLGQTETVQDVIDFMNNLVGGSNDTIQLQSECIETFENELLYSSSNPAMMTLSHGKLKRINYPDKYKLKDIEKIEGKKKMLYFCILVILTS